MLARGLPPLAALLVLTGSAPTGLQRFESVEPHMGVLVRVTVYAATSETAREAFAAAFARIAELDRTLSDYRPDSELNALTRNGVQHPTPVSADLFTVLARAQELSRATGGAFDVTQGPVIRLWREARRAGRLPDPRALDEAARRSGFAKLRLDPASRTATLDEPGMALDLGAIGKGYAASEAVAALKARGISRALVAISGDLAFGEAPPGRRGWRIQLHAEPDAGGIPQVLELTNGAVSTAGGSEQYLEADGRRYSHIIDPASRTGLTDEVTVTVLAPAGLDADGLDTAASLLGPDRGLALIDSHPGAAGLIVRRTSEGVAMVASKRLWELVGGRSQ